jgi:hypothetical protein
MAGIIGFLSIAAQALEEERAVGAADERERRPQKNFRDQHAGKGIGDRVQTPACDAEDRREIEGESIAETVAFAGASRTFGFRGF